MLKKYTDILFYILLFSYQSYGINTDSIAYFQNTYAEILPYNLDSSLVISNQYLNFAKSNQNDTLISDAYNCIAGVQYQLGDYTSALENINKSINSVYKKPNSVYLVNAYNTKALIWYDLSELDSALFYFDLAEIIATDENFNYFKIAIINNKNRIFNDNNEKELFLNGCINVTEIAYQINDTLYIISSLNNLAIAYNDYNDKSRAKQTILKSISLTKSKQYKYLLPFEYIILGTSFSPDTELDSSIYYFKKSIEFSNPDGINYDSFSSHFQLSNAYYKKYKKTKQIDFLAKAINEVEFAENIAKKRNSLDEIKNSYNLKHKLLFKKQDYKNSYLALKKYDSINNLLNNIKNEKTFQNFKVKTNLAEREKEVTNLKLKNEITINEKMLVDKQNFRFKIYLIIGLILLLIILLFFALITKNNQIKRKKIQHKLELEEKEYELEFNEFKRKSLVERFDSLENERDRISRELHDNLSGKIYSIKNKVNDDIELTNDIDKLYHQFRVFINDLSKPIFEDIVSLEESLNLFLFETLQNSKMKYQLDIILQKENDLKENFKFDVFRICQELTINALKHAKASAFSLAIIEEDEFIELIAKDNGIGMNKSKKGHGLTNISSRLKKYKTKLNIKSVKGTEIFITFKKQNL